MIRNLHRSPLREVHQLGQEILNAIKRVMPSLIRYTQPNRSLENAQGEIAHYCQDQFQTAVAPDEPDVVLVESPPNLEKTALAALLFNAGQGSFSACLEKVGTMDPAERKRLIITAHKCISAHEPLRREMELGYFTFGVTLSASAFAQFKRHRIATIIKQDYLPELGCTTPPNVVEAGLEDIFKRCMKISNNLHLFLKEKLSSDQTSAATYALTNAHRRRVIFQANARELTHFSRLREDINAQWDIRNIARRMIRLAHEACPALMMFAAGKEAFDKRSEELFGAKAGKE
jgi:thymidylate synthase ThyX